MMSPYARFRMLVTLNCSVKPTAAIARIEAVISPNPTAGINCCTSTSYKASRAPAAECGVFRWLAGAARSCAQLRDIRRTDDIELRIRSVDRITDQLECSCGVVVCVEGDRTTRADVVDLLAGRDGVHALLI